MSNNENLLGVIRTLYQWRKAIMGLCLIAGILSVVLSFSFLDDYFESTTIFYAASPDLAKPENIYGTSLKDMDYYGNEHDIDRLLTIAKSNEMADYLIEKYDLYKHYEIDPDSKKAAFKVKRAFFKLYDVKKTKFDAIEMSIEDKDKKMAMDMVNDARNKMDEIAIRLIKQSQDLLIKNFERDMQDRLKKIKTLGDTLSMNRKKYGVYNTETQSEMLATLMIKAESKLAANQARLRMIEATPNPNRDTILNIKSTIAGSLVEVNNLSSALKKFNEGMSLVDVMAQEHEESSEQYSMDKEKYKQKKGAYNSVVSALHLVEAGGIPLDKSRPKRSIILLTTLMATFLFSSIGALILDAYRKVDWKEILNA